MHRFGCDALPPLPALSGWSILIQSMFTKVGEGLGFILLLIAAAFWLYGFVGERDQQKSLEEQRVADSRSPGS